MPRLYANGNKLVAPNLVLHGTEDTCLAEDLVGDNTTHLRIRASAPAPRSPA